ncbi:MAG: glycosyltransferase family 2 protein [Candidatus Nanosalina sp.]
MGLQLEQLSFSQMEMPLFTWGGGLVVRSRLENRVTWNRPRLVEDTAFVWKAALQEEASYGVSNIYVRNQAPPSVQALLQQRRRWAGGNHMESEKLSQPYRSFIRIRNYAWGLTPITAIAIPLLIGFAPASVMGEEALGVIGLVTTGIIPLWYLLGILYYPDRDWKMIPGIPVLPFAALLHSLGAIWGIVSPPASFTVTPKKE